MRDIAHWVEQIVGSAGCDSPSPNALYPSLGNLIPGSPRGDFVPPGNATTHWMRKKWTIGPLRLHGFYSPLNHPDGTVCKNTADAEHHYIYQVRGAVLSWTSKCF